MIPTEISKPVCDPHQLRVLIMGAPKCGKTTFCTMNPKAIIMDTDSKGSQFLPCYRMDCITWEDLGKALKELAEPANKSRFDTVALDTVDMTWQRCREFVCKREGVNHESEDKGFGRIWDLVKTEFMKMLNFIAKEGWGVWMTTHTLQKEIKVAGLKRTVTTTILPASAARLIMALSDVILYIDIKENGQRVLVVQPEDTMEVGDRTHALQENIVFTHPKQGYDLMMSKFNVKESATNG